MLQGINTKNKQTKVLLIQLGDIGDVIWTVPAISAVKKAFEGSEVSLFVRCGFGEILENHPDISKVFETAIGGRASQVKAGIDLIRSLRREKLDVVVDFRSGDRGALTALLTGAPRRVSMIYCSGVPFWRNWCFTELVDPPSLKVRGAAEQTLRILRELGIHTDDVAPKLHVSKLRKEKIRHKLSEAGVKIESGLITINPFSRWPYKEWDIRKWAQTIEWLRDEEKIPCLLVGSPAETARAEELKGLSGPGTFNFAGSTGLAELAALLSFSKLHIGVDSAAPHIAAAVGTPTITIYGPSDWFDWAPVGELHKVIIPQVGCAPCHQKGCEDSGISRCLDDLSADRVKAEIRHHLLIIRKVH